MQKNDPNLQKRSDFWLVGKEKHEIRGKRPFENLWGTYGLRGGPKIANLEAQKHPKMGENGKNEITLQICPVFW